MKMQVAGASRSAMVSVQAAKGDSFSDVSTGRAYGSLVKQHQGQKEQNKQQYAVLSHRDNPALVDAALDSIAAAFQQGMRDDPVMQFFGGPPDCPADFVRSALSRHVEGRRRERHIVCSISPAAAALVSVWPFPADADESWWSSLLAQHPTKKNGVPELRLSAIWKEYSQVHGGRFLHISALGVSPELQGRGLGSGLLAWVCGRADAAGLHCVAEAGSERAQRTLQREGFRVIKSWSAHPDMPYVYVMARPPCPATFGSSWVRSALTGVRLISAAFYLLQVACDAGAIADALMSIFLYATMFVLYAIMFVLFAPPKFEKTRKSDPLFNLDAYPWAWSEPRGFLSAYNVRAVASAIGVNVLVSSLPLAAVGRVPLAATVAVAAAQVTVLVIVAAADLNRFIWQRQAAGGTRVFPTDMGLAQKPMHGIEDGGNLGQTATLTEAAGEVAGSAADAAGVTVRRQAGWLRLSRMAGVRRRLARQGGRRRMGLQECAGEVESYDVWSL